MNTTVIKLKAEVNNPSLPVLTKDGLMPYYMGMYVNRLDEQGYTLSVAQKNAVSEFFDDLADNSVFSKVKFFWPFIGSQSNVKAAKVPLIGDKLMDFGDSFNDFSFNGSNEILGLTSFPAVSSVNVEDMQANKGICLAASFIKGDTSVMTENGFFRLLNMDNALQIRPLQVNGTSRRIHLLNKNIIASANDNMYRAAFTGVNYDNAGNAYILLGISDMVAGDQDNINNYVYVRLGEEVKNTTSHSETYYTSGTIPNEDKAKTFSAVPYTQTQIQALTGLVVFSDLPGNKTDVATFMNAMRKMNIALGKEVNVNA